MATTIRPSTLRIYRQTLTAYVIPGLGHYRLADLDPLLLTKHYAALLTVRKQRREGTLSPRTSATATSCSSMRSPTRSCGGCSPTTPP